MMKFNNEAWDKLKQQIEYHIEQDHNLTDVTINYQLRIPERGTRNYLQLSVKIERMTHIEDILRVKNTPTEDLVDYLNARIKALEDRVEFLEGTS
jgi:hypothetical protein